MAKSADITLVLVRSGDTEWDAAGRLQGDTDLPMTPAAGATLDQDASAADLSEIHTVLTAPDEASRETARVIAASNGARTRVLDELHEVGLGLWEGILETDLRERYAKAYRQWSDDPGLVTPPDGEPLDQAEFRVYAALDKALEKHAKGAAAIVLRPIALGVVRGWLLDRPRAELWKTLEEAPPIERITVPRVRFKSIIQSMKTNA